MRLIASIEPFRLAVLILNIYQWRLKFQEPGHPWRHPSAAERDPWGQQEADPARQERGGDLQPGPQEVEHHHQHRGHREKDRQHFDLPTQVGSNQRGLG